MDGQFELLRADLAELGILLNTASNDEHVPEIERQIYCQGKNMSNLLYSTLQENAMTINY